MSRIITAALEGIIVERDMPKGYVWAKINRCWTVHPRSSRFFAPARTEFGDEIPAAYFTAIVAYDPDAGYHEREVKFLGNEAEAMHFALSVGGCVALISAEGHISTKVSPGADGREQAHSIIMLKQGMTRLLEIRPAEEEPTVNMERLAQEGILQRAAEAAIREARLDESIWPSAPEPENLDEAPF